MSNVRNIVISTPELLELIIFRFLMRDLLVTAPLVSKAWQALTLIQVLQRTLIFHPDLSSDPAQNPLLSASRYHQLFAQKEANAEFDDSHVAPTASNNRRVRT
ncbi:hypothetical protein DFH08DRAFT_824928 [Mycena albidolilacea]|uniref:F-box domain-containing protein n=1 Tax=Mycena albidolilacea TaxID=1033008 RepID=A0AAD7E9S6_9AGAR|nr:hypothetical protein DFH08DRAFT_824928 [Mycena albidolilacea]